MRAIRYPSLPILVIASRATRVLRGGAVHATRKRKDAEKRRLRRHYNQGFII